MSDSLCSLIAGARGLLTSEAFALSMAGSLKNVGWGNRSSIQKEMGT